ncbi:MAG: hypothetical protein R3B82_25950 [Sandaracinaceae bacterium]
MTEADRRDAATPTDPTAPAWVARAVGGSVLLAWLVIAAVAWTKSPHGFAFGSLRFALHEVLPVGLGAVAGLGLAGVRWPRVSRGAVEGIGSACVAAAVGCVVCFRESRPTLAIAFAVMGAATVASSVLLRRSGLRVRVRGAVLVVGIASGAVVAPALRAPDPSTHPGGAAPTLEDVRRDESEGFVSEGVLRVDRPRWRLEIDPFFVVQSRSPDRFWTLFAPRDTRHDTRWQPEGDAAGTRTRWRSQDGVGEIAWSRGSPTTLDAAFTVDEPIFTHLARWSRLRFRGQDAQVRFSPCGDVAIDVRPYDYPEGRPARFAYLADGDRFVVAEATSGEKGPFRTLCEGPMRRDEVLGIELLGEGVHVSVELLDYASQASTEPSPTAGWGVPQNAIQLLRAGNRPDGAVSLHFALAATAIGRGWDTVGLAAGTYRNRMRVRWDANGESE